MKALLPALLLLAAAATAPHPARIHAAEAPVTYASQVAPILYNHCTSCHHPGGAGPFSLLTFADAQRHANEILTVTQSRYMPPWLPEPGFAEFADTRRLPDPDRELLRLWVNAGMPAGDPAHLPKVPAYTSDWQLGPPDLILDIPEPFTTPAEGTDVFRNFVLPFPLAAARYIHAIEIKPTTGTAANAVVHHANIVLDRTGSYRRQHPAEWRHGVPGMELVVDAGNTFDPDSHFLFWKPDSPAIVEPTGLEWQLNPGDDLILNMHLKPTGKAETIRARVGLYFSPTPPTKHPMLLQLEHDAALDIPPGEPAFPISDTFTLPIAVQALGIYPHAHYLGHQLQAWAILPDGKKQWLVNIPDWDIDRQSVYRFRAPLLLPAGTVLHMHFLYDNSTGNPRNPHTPPVRVHAGNRSEDEMGHLWLQVLPIQPETEGHDARLLLEQAWMQSRLAKNPEDATALYNLAAATAESGHPGQAIPLYQRILQTSPNDPRTQTAFASAQASSGDWQSAIATYTHTLATNPESDDARFDLAQLQLTHEQPAEAARNFTLLLARAANDPAILAGLAQAELATGDLPGAVTHLTAALALHDDPALRQSLALAYGQSGQVEQAVAQARLAIALTPSDPALHNLLSQLEAELHHLPRAIQEQQAALALAPDDPDAWNNLGVLQARSAQPSEARASFEKALTLAPTHAAARANLARLPTTGQP